MQFKKNRGTLSLEFYDEEDLKLLAELLSPDEEDEGGAFESAYEFAGDYKEDFDE